MHVATIVRDNKNGRFYIRYGTVPKTGGGHITPVETLRDADRQNLVQRAEAHVKTLKGTAAK